MPICIYFQNSESFYISVMTSVYCILSYTITSSITCLFLVLVFVSIIFFRQLLNKMRQGREIVPSEMEMDQWKQNYILICKLVTEINQCFGIVLLITVCYGFLNFINYSFNISNPTEITFHWIITCCVSFLNQALQIFLIMYAGSCLECEVFTFDSS